MYKKRCKRYLALILSVVMVIVCDFYSIESHAATEGNVVEINAGEEEVNDEVTPEITQEPSETLVPIETQQATETETPIPTGTPISVVSGDPIETVTSASIQLLFTSDLHGQLTSTNYSNGSTLKDGGLSRVVTKISEERQVYGEENTFLFDVGDVLYDYTTDFIYDVNDAAEQPIYQVMSTMNYDAITLGNHEFDYELSYIQNQLIDAGLAEKCVVSNLKYVSSGKSVWSENKILERTVKTTVGTELTIRIGIVGETRPLLSKKRTDHTNNIKTEDIVQNTAKQAKKLKEAGADIVVVLAHSGIGVEEPVLNADNAAYALTKIEDVDVVLCGHKHEDFPREGASYYKLQGIDPDTSLSFGKNLICVNSMGKSIGKAELNLYLDENQKISIGERKSTVVKIDNEIEEDPKVSYKYLGDWEQKLIANYSNILAEIKDGVSYQNYFGAIEDTPLIRLVNEAKMNFALQYINKENTKYKGMHVIGMSNYEQYGSEDPSDYSDISEYFLQAHLSGLQKYKTGIYVYCVSGQLLREWLEWSASAYTTADKVQTVKSLERLKDADELGQNVLQKDWETNWSNLNIFDGIEYVIDTNQEPRYSINGNKISDAQRIRSATINGIEIKDTENYIVVGNAMFATGILPTEISGKKIYASKDRCQNIVKNYIEEKAVNGTMKENTDNNWNIIFDKDKKYVVMSGDTSRETAEKKAWMEEAVEGEDGYYYYLADFGKIDEEDTSGPFIIASSLNSKITNKNVKIMVEANDVSGIKKLVYEKGYYTKDSKAWESATAITDSFECSENGIYSILAEDGKGNRSVYYIRVTNINSTVIQTPIVDTYTNRKNQISGTAEPNSKIYFAIKGGKTYSTTVKSNGSFSYKLPVQKAGTIIYVYAVDSSNRTSARVEVTTKRTGPNQPTISTVDSNDKRITGKLNDTYVTPVIIADGKVYVSEEKGKELYMSSDLYNKSYSIVTTNVSIDSSGKYTVKLPRVLAADTRIAVYTIDSSYRKSLGVSTTVKLATPNKPEIINKSITNATTKIGMYIDERCTACVKVSGKTYTTKKCEYISERKQFRYYVTIPRTNSGVSVIVYAQNAKGNSSSITVKKTAFYPNTPKITSAKVNGKTITGTVKFIGKDGKEGSLSETKTKVYVEVNGKRKSVKLYKNGTFKVKVKKIKRKMKIVFWASNINGTSLKGKYICK